MARRGRLRVAAAGVGALAIAVAAACAEGDPDEPPFVTMDSAGVQVATSATPQWPTGAWSVRGEPEVVVGARGGEGHSLFRVQGAAVLSDGRIVVAQAADPIVRWFGPDGDYLTGTGRMGEGPGEFERTLSGLWPFPADSVGTWEQRSRRMHVFDPVGDFVRSVILELPPDLEPGAYPAAIGWSESGMAAYVLPAEPEVTAGVVSRSPWTFHGFGADGSYRTTIGELPGREYVGVESTVPGFEGTIVPGGPPFTNSAWSAVAAGRLYYSPGESLEVDTYGLDGTLLQRMRADFTPIEVTAEIEDEYFRVRAEGSPRSPAEVRASFEGRPFPEHLPAINRIHVDREGSVWLRRYPRPADEAATWTVFGPDGRWLANVEMPAAWAIHDIGPDYVLATVRDELDVEQVMRFRLERGS